MAKAVSGTALIEAGDDGPGMAIAFGGQACLLQTVENPELWEPTALGKGASHIRSRIVMAQGLGIRLFLFRIQTPVIGLSLPAHSVKR